MPDLETVKKVLADWRPSIEAASLKFNVPIFRITAMICQESGGDKDAVGTSGEVGLMQVREGALEDFNRVYQKTYSADALKDPAINIEVGTGYLSYLRSYFHGDLDTATKAYNAGMGNVAKTPGAGEPYLASVQAWESEISLA